MSEIPQSTSSTPENKPLSIVYASISSLRPYTRNARTHTKRQIRMIAQSIQAFGFTNPILTDESNSIVAGHGRVEAAKLIGMAKVPTVRLENLTEDQIRAYVIADNRLAEKAGWDKSILAIELQHLMTLDCGDFDVTITGFEVPEIDVIIEEAKESSATEDAVPEPNLDQPAVTEPGDLWLLGKHRILCGNALHDATIGP
jgi:ParB-like nuclease domain